MYIFFSDDAKGNNPVPFPGFIPEIDNRPPYEIFPIPEQQKPIIEVFPPINDKDIPKGEIFPNNNNIPQIEIFDKSNNIQIAFFVKIKAENGEIVEVPQRLLRKDGTINLSIFEINIKNRSGKKEKSGWSIEDDTGKHGWGKELKLKDEKGNRVASLDKDGKIVSK